MRLESLDVLNTIKEDGQRVYSPNNKPSAADVGARPASWKPAWNDVQSKPSQATRWPSWSEVTGKPSGVINQSALDGRYLLKGAKAVDSDKLDGLDSADFVKNNTTTIMNPAGGSRAGTGYGSVKGAIRLTLPQFKSNTMVTVTVKIYDYNTHESCIVYCGGYNHTSGWANTFAYMTGNNKELKVSFGRNSSKDLIYIGDTGQTWSHLQTHITNVTTGYSNSTPSKWRSGWKVDYNITAFEGVNSTITCGRQYTTQYKPSKADVGLSNVPNYTATSSTTDSSTSRFAVAGAVKTTMDKANSAYALADAAPTKSENDVRYLGKTAKAADANKVDGYDSSQLLRRVDNKTDYNTTANNMTMQQFDNVLPSGTFPAGTYKYGGLLTFNDSSSRLRLYAPHHQDSKSALYISTGWNVDSKARAWERLLTHTDGNSKYLGKTAKAVDSDKLDGINSTSFVRSDVDDNVNGRLVFTKNYTFNNLTDITTAPIHVNANIRQPSGNQRYVPSFHSNSRLSTGYVQHLSIGHKRNATWGDAYFAIGGSDAHPTKEWLFGASTGTFKSPGDIYEAGTSLSSKYLGKTAKASDSNLLDGIDSSKFVRSDTYDILNGSLEFNNYGKGIVGKYHASKFQQVFAMGAKYRMKEDGSTLSTGPGGSKFYGIGWTHSNNTDTNGRKISSHHAVFAINGVTKSAVGDHLWTSGNVYERGALLSARYLEKTARANDSAELEGSNKAQVISEARAGLATTATSDGKYLGKTAKATDAGLLDGINSNQFLRSDTTDTFTELNGSELNADRMGITNTSASSGRGLSLYGGASTGKPTYGVVFAGTSSLKKHGSVTSDWATYFTMSDTANRGWIFQKGTTNVASIAGNGNAKFDGVVTAASFSGKASDSDKLDGRDSAEYLRGLSREAKTITVAGSADKYYPVLLSNNSDNGYAWRDWHIARSYSSTAPATWNNKTHKGGLSLVIGWTGDSSWGGNNKNIRVKEFEESYSKIVGGLQLSTGGLIVWLRGGGANYEITGPSGTSTGVAVYLTEYKAADKKVYTSRTYSSSTVNSEILKRQPIRDNGLLYDSGDRVYSPNNKPTAADVGAITKSQGDGYYLGKTSKAADSAKLEGKTKAQVIAEARAGKAADSNLIDGIDSSRIPYGTNDSACTKLADFNNNTRSGFIESNKAKNQPGTNSSWVWGWQTNHTGGGKYGAQGVVSQDGNYYFRVQDSSGGGTWRKVVREDIANAQYLGKTAKAADSDKLDGINSTQFLRSDANDTFSGDLTSTSRNKGLFGIYDSTKTDQIWSMGIAYRNSSSGANFGNLYGLAYKHTNNKTGGTMAGGHQMVWCTNGKPKAALGDSGVWSAGYVVATTDVFEGGKKLSDKYLLKTGKATSAVTSDKVKVTNSTSSSSYPVVWHNNSNSLYDTTGKLMFTPSTGKLVSSLLYEGANRVYSAANKPSASTLGVYSKSEADSRFINTTETINGGTF